MKRLYTLVSALLVSTLLMAQSPSSFKYQAVLRNIRGDIKVNTDASILIEIARNQATGTVVYSETHKVKTDNFGMIDLEIGKGSTVTGNFTNINWGDGIYFVKITIDGVLMGSAQLNSVPYALYAEKAGNGFSGNYNDLINRPVLFNGTWNSLTGKPAFSIVSSTGNYNDLINKPALFNGTWLSLTGKPNLARVATSGSYNDLINKPTNDGSETKVISGTNISITGTGTNTNPYIVSSTFSGATAPGIKIGDMQYWNGSAWVLVPDGQPGQILKLSSSGEPFWDGIRLATLTTSPVTSISGYSAKSGGNVITDGYDINDMEKGISSGVCWSTSQNPTISDESRTRDAGESLSGTGPYTVSFTGLKALTTYYLRAYATNSIGTAYGNEISFTTAVATTPKVGSGLTTNPLDPYGNSVSWTTALMEIGIISDGGAPITANGVCWNTSPNPTIANSKTNDPTGNEHFVSQITGLTPFTTYYTRAYAINSVGITYGDEISFTTKQLEVPGVSTAFQGSISQTTVNSGGEVLNDGGTPVTARGICWSIIPNPTIANNKTSDNSGEGTFTSSITGLTANTTYYARAYATNSLGTGYGNEIKFTTYTGTLTDVEGTSYNTITIGTQVWMAENLKTKKYNNGDLIGTTSLDITAENEPKYQWTYDDNESNTAIYGRLYSWYAIIDSRKICPTGWHAPSDADWSTLTTYLGGSLNAASKLKEAGSAHWECESYAGHPCMYQNGASNETGFTGLPGGCRASNRTFSGIGKGGYWWSSSEYIGSSAWYRNMRNTAPTGNVASYYGNKRDGLSVRCIKD